MYLQNDAKCGSPARSRRGKIKSFDNTTRITSFPWKKLWCTFLCCSTRLRTACDCCWKGLFWVILNQNIDRLSLGWTIFVISGSGTGKLVPKSATARIGTRRGQKFLASAYWTRQRLCHCCLLVLMMELLKFGRTCLDTQEKPLLSPLGRLWLTRSLPLEAHSTYDIKMVMSKIITCI